MHLIFRFTPGTRSYFSVKLNYSGESGSDSYKLTQSTIETIKGELGTVFSGKSV